MSTEINATFYSAALARGVLPVTAATDPAKAVHVRGAAISLAHAGFLVEPEVLEGESLENLTALVRGADSIAGSDRDWKPVYPMFPRQVKETEAEALLHDQILHYLSGGEFLPTWEDLDTDRGEAGWADTLRNAKTVKATSDFSGLAADLVCSATALSESDSVLVAQAVAAADMGLAEAVRIGRKARNQENLQHLVRCFRVEGDAALVAFAPTARTADSLLRMLYTLYGEPVEGFSAEAEAAEASLDRKKDWAVRYRSMSRAARRALLIQLEKVSRGYGADALVRRSEQWRHIMRMIHPYSVGGVYSRRAVDIIHGEVEYQTFDSLVEAAIRKKDSATVVELLEAHRPGDLFRRLVTITGLGRIPALVKAVGRVGPRVPLTTLISSWEAVHAATQEGIQVTRVAGQRNQIRTVPAVLTEANAKKVASAIEDAIREKLAGAAAPVGTLGIRSDIPVSTIRRDVSSADRVLDRGQTIGAAGVGDVLRFFQHWNNDRSSSGYVDMGVVITDADFTALTNVSWDTWSEARDWATYSGDTCVAPGCSAVEFIDVDVAGLRGEFPDAVWAITTLISYSGWSFENLDVYSGVCYRSEADAGDIFDARSVISGARISGVGTSLVVCATDLRDGRTVWIDTATGESHSYHRAGGDSSLVQVAQAALTRRRFTYGLLAQLWGQAHSVPLHPMVDADRDALQNLL